MIGGAGITELAPNARPIVLAVGQVLHVELNLPGGKGIGGDSVEGEDAVEDEFVVLGDELIADVAATAADQGPGRQERSC